MRVAVDASPLSWAGPGGIQRVATNLLPAIAAQPGVDRLSVFVNGPCRQLLDPVLDVSVLEMALPWYRLVGLPRRLSKLDHDVLLSLAPGTSRSPLPVVQVVQDIYPLYYARLLPRRVRLSRPYWKASIASRVQLRQLRRAAGVIVPSEATAADVRVHLGTSCPPLATAYWGADHLTDLPCTRVDQSAPLCVSDVFSVPTPYLLYVGALNLHKNVPLLVEAFSVVREELKIAINLVLAGEPNWPWIDVGALATVPGVHVRTGLADGDIAALYRGCAAFVCLSRYEGFGLPVLEAMSCGAPVVVSNRGSLPEVVGAVGTVVDPENFHEVCAVLKEAVCARDDPNRRNAVRERAAEFSWSKAGAEVVHLLRQVVEAETRAGEPDRAQG